MNISTLFKIMVEKEASDLYLRTKAFPRARVQGKVEVIYPEPLSKQDILAMTNLLLATEQQQKKFRDNLDIDFIHDESEIGRFRINIFTQRGTPAIVARHVHRHVKTFQELNLPAELLKSFCQESKGLFLACGPAGSGKSTMIASMIEYMNVTNPRHVITLEDPVEFLFEDKKCLINQRELGIDVLSYPAALKHVNQQSPDVIYIGNIRDVETMQAAITSTELGTFVLSTFHTINAIQTIIRMVNFFPPYLHDEVRNQLSLLLKGTVSLRLIPHKDGHGRVPAYETMVVTPTIAGLIREGHIGDIQKYIDQGKLFGMQSFKQSLVHLVQSGLVHAEDARQHADSKDEFDLALKGIKSDF